MLVHIICFMGSNGRTINQMLFHVNALRGIKFVNKTNVYIEQMTRIVTDELTLDQVAKCTSSNVDRYGRGNVNQIPVGNPLK